MFDIGFFELLIVAIVGLLVIGPERLPETVRTIALWFGRLKQSISDTRTELEKQIGADEIRRQLHNERIMKQLRDVRDDVSRTVNDGMIKSESENSDHNTYAKTNADTPSQTQHHESDTVAEPTNENDKPPRQP